MAKRPKKKLPKREGDGWVRRTRKWTAGFDVAQKETSSSSRTNTDNINSHQLAPNESGVRGHNQAGHQGRPGTGAAPERRVVRKRSEREALPGWECDQCRRFYEALASDGFHVPSGAQTCRHSSTMPVATRSGTPPPSVGGCSSRGDRGKAGTSGNDVVQQTSRHRLQTKATSTPPRYWDIDFPSPRPPPSPRLSSSEEEEP
eukprot:GHVU01178583.1.p1 GENE.GHVU01178583.1~~GHVU01178583.1.p1  ORF type:complete len:232 (+),score=26.64 GHVU01178583.1:91-696(+)